MANNTGTLVTSPIRPQSDADTFPSAYANEILGGLQSHPSISGRNAIPSGRRVEGMFASVASETGKIYQLQGGIENGNWVGLFDSTDQKIAVVQTGINTANSQIISLSGLVTGNTQNIATLSSQVLIDSGRITILEQRPASSVGYFIDSVHGYDTNDGLGSSTPVKTVARFIQISNGNISGNRLSIARGSSFEEQLGAIASNGVIASYGEGDLPLFDCRKVIPSFTKTVGRNNVYEAQITVPGNSKMEGNAWADDYMIPQVTGVAQCDSTTGSFYVANWQATGVTTLYVSVPSGTTPVADGKTYRYSAREFGILATGHNVKILGIRTKGNGAQDGGVKVIGTGAILTNVRCDDGARHACYTQASSFFEDCYFYRGRNDLESPGTSNSLVVNQTSITGTSWGTLNCTFDGGNGGLYTGPFGHGGVETDLFDSITHTKPKFINTYNCVAATAKDLQIINPSFTNCETVVSWTSPGPVVRVISGSGTIKRMTNITSSGTFIAKNNNYTVPFVGVGVYRYDAGSGNLNLQISGETANIIDGPTSNNQYIRHLFGAVQVINTTVTPSLCNNLDDILVAGFSTGFATYTGQNNVWPFGARFQLNGITYNTLAAFQSGGFDTGSSTAAFPTTVSSDNFNRPDEFLDVSAGWTKVSGTANQVAVRSGQLAITSATSTSLYRRATMDTPDHWVKFNLTAAPASAGAYVGFKVIDVNNWMGIRATNAAFQIGRCISGVITASVVGSSAVTPASGQSVVVATKDNRIWLYVDGRCLVRGATGVVPSLYNAKDVGVIGRGPLLPYFIDSFECGLVPATSVVQYPEKSYWGTNPSVSLDSSGIRGLAFSGSLTGRGNNFNLNGSGNYLYYAYPASYDSGSTPTFIMGGFVTNAWTGIGPITFTNENNIPTPFSVWRSSTVQGADNIQISVI